MVIPVSIELGGDPELFFRRDGNIIGSEKVIPEKGLVDNFVSRKPLVVRDGVQLELNPLSSRNIGGLGANISSCFRMLKPLLLAYPKTHLCFDEVVDVGQTEFDQLSPETRKLGCLPSKNIYGTKPIDTDGTVYKTRSAGGHIHFGIESYKTVHKNEDCERSAVALADIFVSNFGVLVDRNPRAAERRINYGRAGEYRTPDHGLEYRTLSSFWLKNYTLMNLMFGMAHFSMSLLIRDKIGMDHLEDELASIVDLEKVQEAINTNDFDLAFANYKVIKPFLVKYLPYRGFPLNPMNLTRFEAFVFTAREKGLRYFFPEDPFEHWVRGEQIEFDRFLQGLG